MGRLKMSSLAGPGRRVPSYIGPVDEEEIAVRLSCRKIPSEAWQKANPPGIPTDPPRDEDMVVQTVVLGSYGYPSRLKHPANWDRGEFPLVELAVTPYLEWKAAGDFAIARKKGGEAPDYPVADEKPAAGDEQVDAAVAPAEPEPA